MEEVISNMTIAVMMIHLTCHEVVFLYVTLELFASVDPPAFRMFAKNGQTKNFRVCHR